MTFLRGEGGGCTGRVVTNVTLKIMIINQGEADVDTHTPKGDSFDYYLVENCHINLLHQTASI